MSTPATSTSGIEQELSALNHELALAREQQAATAAILNSIAGTPIDLQSVLNAVVKNAGRLCEAFDATIFLRGDGVLVVAAHDGPIPITYNELPLSPEVVTGRAVLKGETIHVNDLTAAGDEFPLGRRMALEMDFRSIWWRRSCVRAI